MIFLISLVLSVLFVLLCGKTLKRHPVPFYVLAVCLSVAMTVCALNGVRFPAFVQTWIWPLLSRGGLAGGLFVLVMIAGALPNGSKAIRTLMPIRGELSIVASILTLGHNIAYGQTYFKLLLTDPGRLPLNQLAAAICSVVMLIIMLPLFVTSFMCVRKKMNGRTWKKLQRAAYVFYALLYVHIMLLTMPQLVAGRSGYAVTVFAYTAVFAGYAVCRLMKACAKKKGVTETLKKHQIWGNCGAVVLAACMTFGLAACGAQNEDVEQPPVEPENTITENQNTQEDEQVQKELSAEAVNEQEPLTDDKQTEKDLVKQEGSKLEQQEEAKPKDDVKPAVKPETTPTPKPENKIEPKPEPKPETEPAPELKRVYKDGTFSGSGAGFNGDISVNVTIKDDAITGITVTSTQDDDPFMTDAKGIISTMLSKQSADVSTVSGATFSSTGIRDAVKAAMSKAKN